MKKRVLSLLMAIAICLSMLPSAALAEIPGTGTNEVQTEQQITDEQKPEEQKPDEQKSDEQKPDEQKPDEQKPDEQNPDKQNPDEQKPAKAPRKEPAAETHTGDHGGYTLPEGKTWQGVSSLPSDSGYYYLTQNVTISSTWKPANGTVLCLNEYGISMTGNGPVIHVQPDVTFTLCDCNGSQNRYTHGITHGGNGKGAGVLVGKSAKIGEETTAGTNGAVFNMYGGAIYNNYPWQASGEDAASASGVLIGGGTFNMYGGKITENKLTEDGGLGGGVFVANQGSFYMSGGEISDNHATEGGGVFVGGLYGHHDLYAFGGGTFTMSGGSITGNSGTGGGVYVSAGSNTSFTVSGSAQITGNTGSNVYLGEYNGKSNTIKVDGVLDRTASIGVSVETANQVVAENISAENAKRFTSDNKKYSLQYDSTSQTLTLVGHDNHPICGDVTCTDGEHAVKTTWRPIGTETELKAVQMGCYYYLTQDVEIKDTWKPKSGVVLCLNGHSITFVNGDNYSVIEVNTGTFTLCDCSGSKGKITHGYKDGGGQKYPGRGVSVSKNGTFTMYGGSITGNIASSSYGGGVFVGEKGTFTMCGGSITGNTSSSFGGVYMASGAKFTMNGGEISGNTSSTYGGGVYVYRNAEFTMTDGSITDNAVGSSGSKYDGGGVCVAGQGKFHMNGGSITRNTSPSYGGGVRVYQNAEFTMTGGSITDNAAGSSNSSNSYGGGVYSAGTFTMTGGSITRNKAEYGGGVWTDASFTVSGNVNITGNVGINGNTASNVFRSLGTITIGGEGLKPGARIGVTSITIDPGKFVIIATGAKDSCTVDNFTADAGEPYGIKVESTGTGVDVNLYNGLPHEHPICGKTCSHTDNEHTNIEWKPVSDLDAITGAGNYYLTQDVTSSKTWTCSHDVNLCLNGHSITMTGNDNAINVAQNATFTLCDCNGSNAGNGKIIISREKYGVKIEDGTFFMYSGSIRGTGTGVTVSSYSKFNMYGGAIEGNTWHGVNNSGTFNMYDGVIKGNDRCGVYNTKNTFNMYGGSIIDNKAEFGGVYVENGTVNVSGDVTITGNTAKGNTTNVYLPADKTITVSGALGTGAQIGVTTAKELAEGSYLTIAKGIDKNSPKYTLTDTDLKAFTSDVGNSYGKRLNGNSIIFTKGDLHTHALCGASCTHTGTHSEEVWKPLTYDAGTQTLYYGGTAVPSEVKGHGLKTDDSYSVYYTKYTLPSGNYYLVEDITLAGNGSIGGGAIKISSDVNLCLNGKTLSTTVKAYNVDVIGVNSQNGKCTLTLCDCDTAGRGTITSQNRTNSGVQIYGYFGGGTTTYGNLVMYGGTVKGFRNGVVVGDGTFNMFGGTITGNETGVSISSDDSFTIGGTVNITGNTKNVDLGENVTITIDESLTQDARIGVCLRKKYIPTGTVKKQFATGATNSDLNYGTIFSCDNGSQYVVSKDGDSLSFGLHQHSWSYTANGATITATCTAAGCPLEDKNGGSVTISASNAVYDRSSKAATVTASDWQGDAVDSITVTYTGRNGTNYNSTDAPTNAGDYTASITVGTVTARVEYSIEKASLEYTVPTGLTAKYGQTLADISLPTGWAWKDATQSVGSVGEHTFKATYTPGDANYHAVTGIDVTVTVNKAPVTIQITGMPKGPIAYGDTFVLTITQTGDSSAVPANWTRFSRDRHFEYLREQSNPEKGEFKFQATGVCPGNGCSRKFTVEFESDTHKGSLTVSTPNVTKKTLTGEDLVFGGLTTDFTKTYDGSTSFTKASVEIKSGAKVNVTDVLPAVKGSYVYNSKDVKDAKKVTFTSEKTESKNYILPAGLVVEREAKIEPAAITVTPNAVSKTYGADDPVLTYGVSGAVNSETPAFTGALARAEGKNVGDYAINQGTLALADKDTFKAANYKLKFTSKGNLTITKAKPEITAASKQITKNGVEVDITGWATFKNTDSDAKLTYTLVGTPIGITLTGNKLKADPSTTVLTFVIKVSAEATANFTAPDEVTFTVTVVNKDDAGVSITGAPTSKTYGDADFTVTAANGVTESTGNTGKWTWTSSDSNILEITSGANTATPTIKVKKADANGATLTVTYSSITHYGTANVTIKVNPKDVTITGLSAGGKEYDRSTTATPTGTAVIDGKVGSDNVTVTAGTASFDNENVGTDKIVTFTGYSLSGADAGNYNLKAQPASVTANITAKEVTITSLTAADRSYQKDNLSVALMSGTLTGVITGDTVTIDLTNAKGTMTDANAGTGKAVTVTGVALGGDDKDNYRLKEQPTGVTVSITKATAPTLKNITVSQKYSVTTGEKAIGTVMPADAGTLTYAKGTESKTGSVTVTNWAVDATGKVTYTLSGGAADNTVTLPVIIKSTNYVDATVNVVITLTAKDNQAALKITGGETVVYGQTLQLGTSGGSTNGAVTYTVTPGTGNATVDNATGKLTPTQVGNVTVTATMAGNAAYNDVTSASKTITITQATPTGTPIFTKITEKDKTLADAALGIGTLTPIGGKIEWVDDSDNVLPDTTKVEANKEYKWRYTPATADAVNYTTLTGTIVLYPASTGIVIYTPVNDAIFLSGANQIVAPGGAATFRINKNFGEFRSVAVDGVTLDKSNYRAWSGSTYVKLTPAYMKTLSAGTHTLAVYFTGATATTTFTISAGSSNPATGASDFAGVGAAVAMAAVSLLGAAAVLRRK